MIVIIVITVVAFVAGILVCRAALRAHFNNINRLVGDDIVDEAKYISLGGVRQWITIRGRNRSNPILLFLHGGPGTVFSGLGYSFQPLWEEYFTVVNWDQRGAGRSIIDLKKEVGGITFEAIYADAVSLIDYLKTEYGQDKIFVVGHSWGSFIGVHLAKRRPDLLHAYVGVGQLTGLVANTMAIREEVKAEAERRNDTKTLAKLAALPETIPAPTDKGYIKWVGAVAGMLPKYGMSWHNVDSSAQLIFRILGLAFLSPQWKLGEIKMPLGGNLAYGRSVFQSIHDISIREDLGTRFEVPVILVSGKYDNQAPRRLAQDYFDKIEAPHKEMHILEHSAHVVFWEEPGKVLEILRQTLAATRLPRTPVRSSHRELI